MVPYAEQVTVALQAIAHNAASPQNSKVGVHYIRLRNATKHLLTKVRYERVERVSGGVFDGMKEYVDEGSICGLLFFPQSGRFSHLIIGTRLHCGDYSHKSRRVSSDLPFQGFPIWLQGPDNKHFWPRKSILCHFLFIICSPPSLPFCSFSSFSLSPSSFNQLNIECTSIVLDHMVFFRMLLHRRYTLEN